MGLLVYTLTCLYVFRDTLLTGGQAVASLGGDPVKNTFSFLYHAAYGRGLWFEGMAYPFGEHLSFADGQPLVTLPVRWLGGLLHLSQPHLLWLMYVAIALSFIIGMVYTQRLLTHFGVHPAWAIGFSALILIMSPHIYRANGHYPLSYAVFLPMLFYWSVGYYETGQNRFLVRIFLLFFTYAFLHLYFLAMGLLWAAAYAAGAFFFRRGTARNRLRHGARYLLPTVGAFGLAQVILRLTDPVRDRPVFPYMSPPELYPFRQLLTTIYSPIWRGLKEDHGLIGHINESIEGLSYLGVVPVVMLLFWGLLRVTGGWKKISAGQPPVSGQWLFIALITLLFAATVKDIWTLPFWEGLLRPLRQFRAPERFSWIAYYVLSVWAALGLWRLCRYLWLGRHKIGATALGLALAAVWAVDANGAILYFHRANQNAFWNSLYLFSKETSWKAFLAERGYRPSDFQAVLALPFVQVGSEKIWLSENYSYCLAPAFKVALEMQLPVLDVNMSRTSWGQTFEAVRLVGGTYADQSLLRRLPDARPLLAFHFMPDGLSPDEEALLDPAVADSLGTIEDCRVFAFWPRKFLARQANRQKEIQALAATLPVGDTSLNSAGLPTAVAHFENGAPAFGLAGNGLPPIGGEDSLVLRLDLPADLPEPARYEFSGWSKVSAVGPASNYFQIRCYDAAGAELSVADALGKYSTDNAPDMWFRISRFLEFPKGSRRVEVKVVNPDRSAYRAMDELLLRPEQSVFISKSPNGALMVNNHFMRR